jgi:hypothetical protein
MGENLPDWLVTLNTIGYIASLLGSIIFWELHKEKVEELEKEIKRLKETQNK